MNITNMYEDKFLFKEFETSNSLGGSGFSLTTSEKETTTTLANLGSFMPRLSGQINILVYCSSLNDKVADRVSVYLYDGDTVVTSEEDKSVRTDRPSTLEFNNVSITAYKKYTIKIKSAYGTIAAYLGVKGYIVEQCNKYMVLLED